MSLFLFSKFFRTFYGALNIEIFQFVRVFYIFYRSLRFSVFAPLSSCSFPRNFLFQSFYISHLLPKVLHISPKFKFLLKLSPSLHISRREELRMRRDRLFLPAVPWCSQGKLESKEKRLIPELPNGVITRNEILQAVTTPLTGQRIDHWMEHQNRFRKSWPPDHLVMDTVHHARESAELPKLVAYSHREQSWRKWPIELTTGWYLVQGK